MEISVNPQIKGDFPDITGIFCKTEGKYEIVKIQVGRPLIEQKASEL